MYTTKVLVIAYDPRLTDFSTHANFVRRHLSLIAQCLVDIVFGRPLHVLVSKSGRQYPCSYTYFDRNSNGPPDTVLHFGQDAKKQPIHE